MIVISPLAKVARLRLYFLMKQMSKSIRDTSTSISHPRDVGALGVLMVWAKHQIGEQSAAILKSQLVGSANGGVSVSTKEGSNE